MKGRRLLGLIVVYLVSTVVMTSPYVNWVALGSASYPGDARLMIWTLAWSNHAMLNGLPLLDANIFYPAAAALTYNDPLVGISFFTLPIYALTGNVVLAYNLVFLLAFVLNGLAMHTLAYRLTGNHAASLVGGLTYAFSFYMMLHAHGHLSLVWAWPLPLSFVLLDRWVSRPTFVRAAAWGAAVVLQVLASWYLAVIAITATAIMVLWLHASEVRDRWGSRAWQLAVVTFAAASAVWPLAAPYRGSLAPPGITEVRRLSADWASYFVPPANTVPGQWWLANIGGEPRWIWGELTLFLGWMPTALAAVGLVLLVMDRRWRRYGGFLLIGVAGLVLSFGPAGPRSDWPNPFDALTALPGFSAFRAPARFGLLVLLSTSILAAYGVAEGIRRFGRPAKRGVAVLVPLMLVEWFVVDFPSGRPQPAEVPAIYGHSAIRTARALVSLPDYRDADAWFDGADYLLYSTAHWRPIVNGYGRAEPDGHHRTISHMRAFPGPNNAATMRELGIEFVVLHTARYPDGAAELLAGALESPEYDLVAREGTDYLFRVTAGR